MSFPIHSLHLSLKWLALQRRDELLLSEHFSEAVRRVRKSLPGSSLKVLNFDWHGMMKDLKEEGTVEGFWTLLESLLPIVSFTFRVHA